MLGTAVSGKLLLELSDFRTINKLTVVQDSLYCHIDRTAQSGALRIGYNAKIRAMGQLRLGDWRDSFQPRGVGDLLQSQSDLNQYPVSKHILLLRTRADKVVL